MEIEYIFNFYIIDLDNYVYTCGTWTDNDILLETIEYRKHRNTGNIENEPQKEEGTTTI